jgi:membrane-bound ClpP family serine protease
MSLSLIIVLIAIGVLLLIVELLVIPGITIAGIGGFILIVAGIFFAYQSHDNTTGNYVLLGSGVLCLIMILYALRTKTWQNVGLKSNIDGRVETFDKSLIHEGDEGITMTRLAPIGKAMVKDIVCEAKSRSGFIDENTQITVVQVFNNQIIVKPKNI